jgi:tryptophan-rich sensory protein
MTSRGRALATAAVCAFGVAVLGGLSTDIGPWYADLNKPAWQPPDFLFGPVWTLIYALCALSAAEAWRAFPERHARRQLLLAWGVNATLNVLWSLLFFRLRRPDWALFEVVLLWASIVMLLWLNWRRSRLAAWLLLPYLGWVSFAAVLNWAVVRLNP